MPRPRFKPGSKPGPKPTLAYTLRKTIMLWQFIALNPQYTKKQVYRLLHLAADNSHCPCCEYVLRHEKTCKACPLVSLWPDTDASTHCMAPESIYHTCAAPYGDVGCRIKGAKIIAEAAVKLLREVRHDRRTEM